MAAFNEAYKITIIGNEGGWNPGIGETPTYEGIDRGMHPDWSGWPIIDRYLSEYPGATIHTINQLLAEDAALQTAIQAFYKANFWDDLNLSQINDDQVADNVFDSSVNPCIMTAGKVLQTAVNTVLTTFKAQLNGANIGLLLAVDGNVGTKTITAVNLLPPALLHNTINSVRRANYIKRAQLTPKDAQWLPVWERRLKEYVAN